MTMKSKGIHHITAIVGDPQENIDFYTGVLGLRLVKKTVNFDDPGTYHFYFGDEQGSPGTIITFFPWPDAYRGQVGGGQVGVTVYSIPVGSMAFWKQRLAKFEVEVEEGIRFGETYLQFVDPHGLVLQLVERESGKANSWSFGSISAEYAIKGFGGAVLFSFDPVKTKELLAQGMGLQEIGKEGDYTRFEAEDDLGNIVDVYDTPVGMGRMGVGTVHHIAWRATSYEDHEQWREHILSQGYSVTQVIDRQYFHAIYFRETGGILFEIATDPPGFATDEELDHLGEKLKLPEWYEPKREEIEKILQPVEVRVLAGDQS